VKGLPILRRVLNLAIVLPVAAVILVAIVYAVGFEKTAEAIRQAGVGAFGAVGILTAIVLILQAGALAALNRPIGHRIRFRTLFNSGVVGLGGNILTPSTHLGGEPLKIVYLGRTTGLPYHEITGTVVLGKYLEAISFILLFSFSAIVAAAYYRDVLFGPYLAGGVAILVVAGMLLALCWVLWLSLSQRWRPLTALVTALAGMRVLSHVFSRLRERTQAMEDQVSRVFCEEGPAARKAFGALLLGHLAIFVKPAAFFYLGARMGLGLGPLCLMFAVGQALLAFQLTPSGAGTLDGGLIGTFALIGLDEAQCMAFLLCLRFWDIVLVGSAALLATRAGAHILSSKGARPGQALLEAQEAGTHAESAAAPGAEVAREVEKKGVQY
jgi:uncharacterized protein (TIRG00374 family)